MNPTSAIKPATSVAALCLIVGALLACQLSSLKGKRINLFEQTNAQQAAAKIKEKIGVDSVKISSIEIRAGSDGDGSSRSKQAKELR